MFFGRPRRLALAVLIFCIALVQGCEEDGGYFEKRPAPDFALTLFDGNSFRLSNHRDGPVIINFFASWCIPCKAEAAVLEKTFQAYRARKVTIVGIAIQDTETKAREFVAEHGLTFPTGIDLNGNIKEAFGVYGLPTTYFVDKQGVITYLHVGLVTEDLLKHELGKIL